GAAGQQAGAGRGWGVGAGREGDAGVRVPGADFVGVVWSPGPADDVPAIGAEAHAPDGAGVSFEGARLLARAGVPDLHRVVFGGAGQAGAVGAEAHAGDGVGVPLEGADLLAGERVPDLHRLVPGGG